MMMCFILNGVVVVCCLLYIIKKRNEQHLLPGQRAVHATILLYIIILSLANEEAMHQAETATTTREGGVLSHYALLKIEMN